jgi:ABC-type bacteriocin/lantibiotic exporter with double-glycine peptidase domain
MALNETPLSPFQRLVNLLTNERKDIGYIYFYAIAVGLISLILPLGVQAIFNLVKTGSVFSSVYLLMGLVIIGLLASGIMQIVQVSIVEVLQKRIFAKAAFEFSYRLPRIKTEALFGSHPPELMNRFFDVLTIQKALPKFLIDITAAALQILFGLLLLSFYHPFFIAFGALVLLGLVVMVRIRGKKGLETSIQESKYKYKVVQWLEEMAGTIQSFKLAGNTPLPIQKMDGLVNNYLSYRSKHFKILKEFYVYALVFKILIIGGLLILGTYLLVNLQISLGQFVASEIIIVLLTGAVEKLILSIDIIFDLLTAVDKIGHVTDLPNEPQGGHELPTDHQPLGFAVRVADLSYQYPDTNKITLHNLTFNINAGERVCIMGQNGSGKNTLANVLAGVLTDYQGSIQYNGFSMKDLNINTLRDYIEMNIPNHEIFDGTILENLTMGRDKIKIGEVQLVLEQMQLSNEIALLPNGLNTQVVSGGKQLPLSFITKIALARLIIAKPKLLIYNDALSNLEQKERTKMIQLLTDQTQTWTLIVLSNDPIMMAACGRTLVMNNGQIKEK